MEPTHGDFDLSEVDGIDELKDRMADADSIRDWSFILSDYISFGNNKIAKNTGIFNMNSATDCPNAKSDESDQSETGVCQVPWESCYAHKAENIYPNALKKRRLQEYLWDNVDAQTFAEALLRVKSRKRSAFDYLRVSESGDFRGRHDVVKWDQIAKLLGDEIAVYTYSASHKIDWSEAEHFVVNQSNNLADYGDRLFSAVPTVEDIPDDAIFCPFESAKVNGVDTDDRPKCGECTHCIEDEDSQPKDVFITVH